MPGPADDDRIPEAVAPHTLSDFGYGDLEKGKRIGTGGDADAYRATLDQDGYTYPIAVKEPRFEGTIRKRVFQRFETEAETWESLNHHENVVSVYTWGAEPLPWLALEFMDGGTLEAQLGSIDVAEALWLSGRIAEGIRYGHRHGVAHLDIKPTNVLLRDTPEGKWDYPKVSDWGLAKMLLDHSNSIEGISPTYAAPEQFDAEEYGSPDDITDIYQLGTLVYALVAGEPPFSGSSTAVMQGVLREDPDPPSTVNPEVPAAVDEAVLKALAKDKADRYDGVLTFRKELDRLFAEHVSDDVVGGNPPTASPAPEPTDRTTERDAETVADSTGTVATGSRTGSRSAVDQDEGSPASATRHGTGSDGAPLVSRRSVLGLLSVGVLGGGGVMVTRITGDDEPSSSGSAPLGGSGDGGGGSEYSELGNYPIEGDTATFGFTVPQSGPYAAEGEDELRGYELAVDHLNNGGGWVDSRFDDLSGDGVLDYRIDSVSGDTETDADTARQWAARMIRRDDAIMVSGGSSSAVTIAVQDLCQQERTVFMGCLTHSNYTTGRDCLRYGFREMFNVHMTGQALAPVLRDEYGEGLQFYQLYADYSWGRTQQESMNQFLSETAGWKQVDSVATPLGTSDYSSYLSEAANSGADVLVLNHYGLDGATSVSQAVDAGLAEDMELVVPLYNRPMAEAAGAAIEGVFGTVAWDAQIDNTPSQEFLQAFQDEYDRVPSGVAHLAYAQTLQYAAAVERAGTFYPPEVIRQLEDYEYDNIGMGSETMRACDHQAQRAVPVVRGLPESEQRTGQYYELIDLTSRDELGYGCDEGPAAECELGEYGDE
ncbi:hypothetical protein EI982_07485 [Haloplanus rallus]|uniref:Protein kinase domain-containing protein n=2 Tax=Haloplanus rallus TaxID=1816183 RepID=A0A6B9F8E7_9EURY|nr:hypothetical protein EI982_07485 [Haloplanus rallus]